MSKRICEYSNVKFKSFVAKHKGAIGDRRNNLLGAVGSLEIRESEKKRPGKKFVVFFVDEDEDIEYIKTSLGDICEDENTLKIYTHGGSNMYEFDMTDSKIVED